MTPEQLLQFAKNLENLGFWSIAGVIGFYFIYSVLPIFIDYFKGKLTEKTIENNLRKCFEENHFSDYKDFKSDVLETKRTLKSLEDRVLKIEIKIDV